MKRDTNPDHIYTSCTIDRETREPLVLWSFGETQGTWSLENARDRAEALMSAAAFADSEGAIADVFLKHRRKKAEGFQPSPEKQQAAAMLHFLRETRPALMPGVNPIFGMHTEQAIVEVCWFPEKVQLDPKDARSLAMSILQSAEASETDRFLYRFYDETLALPHEDVEPILIQFREFREKETLNRLYHL